VRFMGDYSDKRILVMGGASGIGRATVERFLGLGAKIAVFDINKELLQAIEAKFSKKILPLYGDVRNKSDIDLAVELMVKTFGGIDVFVYSVGIFPNRLIVDMSENEWDTVMDINVKGAFLSCQAIAKQLITQGTGGHIITISSGSYQSGRVGSGHYCASKGALAMLTKVLAIELAPYGILVNSIAPGLIENPVISEEYKQQYVQRVPMGRIGRPDDVSSAIEMIVSSNNTFITGQVISVDGGISAGAFGLPFSSNKDSVGI